MSEKAECPRCKAYASQVHYDGYHEHCGWNCGTRVYRARLEASAMRTDNGYGKPAEMEVCFESPLTDEQILALRSAFAQALSDTWGEHGEPSLHVWIDTWGVPVDPKRMEHSPWWFGTLVEAREWLEAHPPKGDKWTHANTAKAHWRRVAKFYGLGKVAA